MKTTLDRTLTQSLARLIATPPDPVRSRLLQRVHASAHEHRSYLTLRHERYRWQPLAPGMREQRLRQDGWVRVSLWQIDAGMPLVLPDDIAATELLVVQGRLQGQAPDGSDSLEVHSYLTLAPGAGPLPWHAAEPTLLYVRSLLPAAPPLPELEAHWWQLAARQAGQLRRRKWVGSAPGVNVMPLCGDATVVSMLVRFDPGGAVADHHHALDEDCLVLAGEMFLGDILLRALDYQLAPAGGTHFGEMSDVGVTFFFHGALDPVLLG
jgi:hypothetical protein